MAVTYEKVAEWLIPALISAALVGMNRTRKEMSDLTTEVAVATSRLDELERRMQGVEVSLYGVGRVISDDSPDSLPSMRNPPIVYPGALYPRGKNPKPSNGAAKQRRAPK